ncbi:unnamed protein product [[Candida] boidinii]|nr:unnamed protein product [[Candida] boidinii]
MSEKVTATGTDIDSWVNSEMETTPEVQDHKQNQNISDSNKSNNNSIQNLETFPNPEKHQEYTPVSFPDPELKPQSRSKSQSQPQSQIRSYSQSPTKSNQSSHMPLPSPQPLPVLPPLPMRKTSTGGMALPPRPSTSPLLNSKISPSLSPSLAPPSPSSSSSSSSSSSPSSPLSLKDSHHHRTRM